MKKISCQHGDLIVEVIGSIPTEAKKVSLEQGGRGLIIERGEGSNTHVLEAESMSELCGLIDCYELKGELYFRVKKGTIKLTHEEHGTQILKPGIYKKNIEQVFDYEKMESEKVRD